MNELTAATIGRFFASVETLDRVLLIEYWQEKWQSNGYADRLW